MFEIIALDADDTLWDNELLFARTQDRLRDLLAPYLGSPLTTEDLYAREQRNLGYFGYGVKGFGLSMIETAVELTDGRISGRDIAAIIDLVREQLNHPVELLEFAEQAVSEMAQTHILMLITKGDLLEQERKIERSGLARYFKFIEIVSEKSAETYRRLFERHGVSPAHVLMVGNSIRSDILPVLEIGAQAVYIPYAITWVHEASLPETARHEGYYQLENIGQLPRLVARLEGAGINPARQEASAREV